MRVSGVTTVVGLLTLVALAGPAEASCHRGESGVLFVPLPQGAPPTMDAALVLEPVGAVAVVGSPPVGAPYALSTALDVTMCSFDVCVSLPDFNVAWYDAEGALIRDDQDLGSFQQGVVPDGAADALVYFRTAQYVLTTPLQDNWFNLYFYC